MANETQIDELKKLKNSVAILSQALRDIQTPPYANNSLALKWITGRAITALAAIPKEI